MPQRARKNDTPRSQVLTFRVTTEEGAAIAKDAARAGLTVSGYLTAVIVRRKTKFVEPEHKFMDPRAFNELRRWGNNLNQLAHATNASLPPDVQQLVRTVHKLVSIMLEEELLAKRVAHARESIDRDDGGDAAGLRQWVPTKAGTANQFADAAVNVWERAGPREER